MEKDTSSGSVLRKLREKAGLSVKEVVEKLKDYGQEISDKTLYSYESQKRAISGDMLLALCQIYKCNNILETFANIKEDYDIPDDDEWSVIETYRLLDPYGRETVKTIMELEAERSKDWFEIVQNIDNLKLQLSDKEVQLENLQSKLSGQSAQIIELEKTTRPKYFISYYQRMASAGSGEYLFDDIPTDLIEVLNTPTARRADFVIGVNGHSMEPDFQDGDKVFVKKAEEIPAGSVGVFLRGNECFIKELGNDRLISHNSDKDRYPDIPASEDIRCVGLVLGRVEE